ncbi:YeeE/YedE thiosulfate transporter family protein [uncultured Piscinibacter sp.]|uniref:YeeE/YedE thiosulfate transporter family protein n=1 Tax=uncultured Piscinibacter sp. TaxID=1131835 RepID=UPI002627CF27|nr:YeeE/YedE thiosulfate transporter family protein [uncultured Piscinibacter sp.]
MDIMLASVAFALAVLCAATMGFAIQRGATCTVAAVDELLGKRSARRLAAFGEAALWVAGGLLAARAADLVPQLPPGYATSVWTVAGGALLGLGAWLNRACVFGAIARLGSGEWAYAATPLGFYLGCLAVPWLFAPPQQPLAGGAPVLAAPGIALGAFLVFVAWRLLGTLRRGGLARWRERVWAPHAATTVIGITFLAMLLLVGAWAYTDALAALARGMTTSLPARLALAVALLAGAVWGGWTAGRFRATRIGAWDLLRCTAGGALMGAGTLLIPGSNDGLILVGMPLLWPYAWVGFATMCAAIGLARLAFSQFDHGGERATAAS